MGICTLCSKLCLDVKDASNEEKVNNIKGKGSPQSKIMVVSENPSLSDCVNKSVFNGYNEKAIYKNLGNLNVNLEDVYFTYAVKCRTISNIKGNYKDRQPCKVEINNCRKHLYEEINIIKPNVILAFGSISWEAIVSISNYTKWVGRYVWSNRFNCYVVPILNDKEIHNYFEDIVGEKRNQLKYLEKGISLKDKVVKLPHLKRIFIRNGGDLEYMYKHIFSEAKYCAICIHTREASDPLDKYNYKNIECFSFSWKDNVGVFVPRDILFEHRNLFKKLIREDNIEKVVYGLDDVWHYLKHNGIDVGANIQWDIKLLSHLNDENRHEHTLEWLIWEFLYWGEIEKTSEDTDLMSVDHKSIMILKLFRILKEKIESEGLIDIYLKTVLPMRNLLNNMEQNGLLIDRDYLNERNMKCDTLLNDINNKISEIISEFNMGDFNPLSSKQKVTLLYDKLNLPKQYNRKTGKLTSDQFALEALKDNHIICNLLLDYNKLSKYKNTYIIGYLNKLHEDNRIRTSFLSNGTVTGRLTSVNPNCQSIPNNPHVRRMVVPPKDYVLIDVDYSQLELRWLAFYSQDNKLLDAFNNNEDLHTLTASGIFNTPIDLVTKEQRGTAKAINFGIIYGRGATSLAEDLNIKVEEARGYIRSYLERMPGVSNWIESIKREVLDLGYVSSFFGRRRRFPNIENIKHSEYYARTMRQAVNSVIQISASDFVFTRLIEIDKYIKNNNIVNCRMVLTMHDSLLIEIHREEVDNMSRIIKDILELPLSNVNVPMNVDLKIVETWGGDTKNYDEFEDVLKVSI